MSPDRYETIRADAIEYHARCVECGVSEIAECSLGWILTNPDQVSPEQHRRVVEILDHLGEEWWKMSRLGYREAAAWDAGDLLRNDPRSRVSAMVTGREVARGGTGPKGGLGW